MAWLGLSIDRRKMDLLDWVRHVSQIDAQILHGKQLNSIIQLGTGVQVQRPTAYARRSPFGSEESCVD